MPMNPSRPTLSRLAAALAVAGGVALAAPAQAETFNLGLISSNTSVSIGNDGLPAGWINDLYTFTVAEGASIDFSGFVSSIFGTNVAGAANLGSSLYSNDPSFVQVAGVSTRPVDGTTGVFERLATYGTTVLTGGSYGLYVTGLVQGTGTGAYSGTVNFGGVAAPVPEPEAMALMALGLVGVGAAAARRKRSGTQA